MQIIKDTLRASPFRKPKFKDQLFGIIMSLICGAAGVFLFITHFFNPLMDSRRAQNWVQIDATVLTLELEKKLNLEYSYHYGNKDYSGNQISFTKFVIPYSHERIKEMENQYPKGSAIPIWINPSNTEESVFDKELNLFNWLALIISLSPIIFVIWKFTEILLQNKIYRIRKRITEEIANYASQHSAHEISDAIRNNDWETQESYRVSYLKYHNLQYFYSLIIILLKLNCIFLGAFLPITIIDRVFPTSIQYFYLFIFILCNLGLPGLLLKIAPKRTNEDYIILSTWDQSLKSITYHWLLLSNPSDVLELGLQTTSNDKDTKKHLKDNPIQDLFKEADALKGSVTHTIEESTENYYKLILCIKDQTTGKSSLNDLFINNPAVKNKR